MNREIKFRAWSTVDKKMLDWSLLRQTAFNRGDTHLLYDIFSKSTLIPLQYIGLPDKNGKEIYEGDILNSNKGKLIECVFINGGFRHKQVGFDYTYTPHCFNPDEIIFFEVEVIGNFYENPELLALL